MQPAAFRGESSSFARAVALGRALPMQGLATSPKRLDRPRVSERLSLLGKRKHVIHRSGPRDYSPAHEAVPITRRNLVEA